uniref:Dynein-1-alpha heavy chain, flagellar inner arm I1 complex n=2 Tax=Cacopsylla melanoneura TaxID=428564 RepID=A0A8D9E4G7_9HEMI
MELTACSVPVLFILQPGCDPEQDLRKLALNHNTTLTSLPMCQGQEQAASSLIKFSALEGHWVLLSNIHLVPSFTRHLESIITTALNDASLSHKSSYSGVDVSSMFRLFVTTDPSTVLPIRVLQRKLKVCLELPTGLQKNMFHLYSKVIDDQLLEQCKHPQYKDLVYVMAFLHSVLLERRNYSTLGWNVRYVFSQSDFEASVATLCTVLDNGMDSMHGEQLKYLIGEIMYGGRVSDMYDRRIVKIFMDEYIGDYTQNPDQFAFYPDRLGRYKIPSSHYLEHIEKTLPFNHSAELIGLHASADTGLHNDLYQDLVFHLKEMYPEVNVKTKDQVVEEGLAGQVCMDDILECHLSRLYSGVLIDEWRALAPPTTMKLGAWLEQFKQRGEQYRYWIDFGDPLVMWLPGLHYPYSYFTAIIQKEVSKKEGWSLDRCSMYTEMSKFTQAIDVEEPPPEGAYVNGLYLQGAHWDLASSCLVAPASSSALVEPLPILTIIPKETSKIGWGNTLCTPVYRSLALTKRDKSEFEVNLRMSPIVDKSVYVLRGVTLFLDME